MGLLEIIFSNVIKNVVEDYFNSSTKPAKLPINDNNIPNDNQDKIDDIRKRIAKNKEFPTAEKISFSIGVNVYNILLHFFPNTFKTAEEAFDFYQNFCKKAKELGENESVYNSGKLLKNSINIDINLNMLTGETKIHNWFYNNDSLCVGFNFFNYEEIKNTELRQEIENIYNENWEFLEGIGMCYTYSDNVRKSIHSRIDITPYGLDYYRLVNDYDKFQFWFSKHHDIFQLPIDDIICAFRECQTYYLEEKECEELVNKIKNNKYKDIYRLDLNFKEKSAVIFNKFLNIYMNIEYFYPAETITSYSTEREFYYINPFKSKYYGS